MWEILQEKMYKTHITDLDELKHQLRTEWAKLDHVVIATAIHQWRHRSTANIKLTSKTLCRLPTSQQ